MIRSMYAAVSGLRSHQEMINVTGNNIANVNTTGFKKSQVLFQEILGQTIVGAAAPTPGLGGTNPAQLGLGVRVGAIAQNLSQGALNRTGRVLDMAIEGDGFFMFLQGGQQLYTRAGSFFLDADGRMVTAHGGLVQGWKASPTGALDPTQPVGTIRIPLGDQAQPQATTRVDLGGNLPADAPNGTVIRTGLNVFDAQGAASAVNLAMTKSAANQWDLSGDVDGTPLSFTPAQLTFAPDGSMLTPANFQVTSTINGTPVTFTMGGDGDTRRATSYAGEGSMTVVNQNGAPTGTLQALSIGQDGVIFGSYTNGLSRPIAQLALAIFANPEGLERTAGTNFRVSANSGLPQIGTLGTGGRGLLNPGSLEGSNVDLAEEFTDLIRGQRGFQANSRVITTSDEMLQEVVNLKR
jgi:flagellar hook protein FlgE